MREKVTILPTSMYLSKMHDAGWSLVALEWEREVETTGTPEPQEASGACEELPFGLRISSDCHHLEDGPPWNAATVFQLTPRLIDVAPRILSGAEWESRKKQLTRVAWNS